MTFLIITADPSTGAELAKRIKEQAPESFCFSVSSSTVEEALNTVQVDCAICPPELADTLSRRQFQRLAVWPPEENAASMAKALLPHHT